MDRFNTSEDIEFHPEAFSQGRDARLRGLLMWSANWFQPESWMWKSFNAGWADADMDSNAPKELIYGSK